MNQTQPHHSQRLELQDSAATLALASRIGARLKGGEVIELIGDLGAGKTTFVIGLARGAGTEDIVSSPSFTLRNDYRAKRLNIAHFDLFRLSNSPEDISELLKEALSEPHSVVVIEWADTLSHVLPDDRIKIKLKPIHRDSREIVLAYPRNYAYLFKEEEF